MNDPELDKSRADKYVWSEGDIVFEDDESQPQPEKPKNNSDDKKRQPTKRQKPKPTNERPTGRF